MEAKFDLCVGEAATNPIRAAPDLLAKFSFLVVCYGSNEGDVGYYLKVKDFLNLENPVTVK